LNEITELFESPFIHIGGDEAPKTEWKACRDCTAKLAEINSDNFEDLQGHFTFQIAEYLKSKGKKPICWNETLKAGSQPENLTIQYWMPGVNDKQVLKFFKEGKPIIFSDMFRMYLDYPHAVTPLKRVYEYNPSIDGELINASSIYGLEACLWAERIDTSDKLERHLFPRIYAVAENAWSIERDYNRFKENLCSWISNPNGSSVIYTHLDDADPEDDARTKALFETLSSFNIPGEPDENRIDPSVMFSGGEGSQGDFAKTFMEGFGIDPAVLAERR
jgi:hexosaminidase